MPGDKKEKDKGGSDSSSDTDGEKDNGEKVKKQIERDIGGTDIN